MAPVHDLLSLASLCANKEQRPQVLDVGCGPGTWFVFFFSARDMIYYLFVCANALPL